jgi:hypothetical protein
MKKKTEYIPTGNEAEEIFERWDIIKAFRRTFTKDKPISKPKKDKKDE